jgi:hypothetical protein
MERGRQLIAHPGHTIAAEDDGLSRLQAIELLVHRRHGTGDQ